MSPAVAVPGRSPCAGSARATVSSATSTDGRAIFWPMPNEQSPAERHIARSRTDDEGMGKPLSRRTRQTRRTVEAYLAAGVMPRYMERLREIEAERVTIRNQLARTYRRLQEA